MQASRLKKYIFFLASITLSYSRHISLYNADIQRILPHNENDDKFCMTPGCVKTAADILSFLDESVDPCENFYKFACGGWLNSHVISEDRDSVSVDTEIVDGMNLKLKNLVDKNLDGTEPPFKKMLKNMYDTCMDLESIEKAGSEPLKKDLKRLGGWPVVEGTTWDESRFNWVDTLIAFRKLGYVYNTLMALSVSVDGRNTTSHIIELDQVSFGALDRDYLVRGLNDSVTAAYHKMMVEEAVLLGADEIVAKKELLKSLQFEIDLAKYSSPDEERRDFSRMYNKYTIAELQNMIPQIPWLRYINGLLNDEIDESENIIVAEPMFLKNLVTLLQNSEKRVVANYMYSRIVSQSSSLLSKEWRDSDQEYISVLTGQNQEKPRWIKCLSYLKSNLGIALSSYYVRHYFKEDSKDGALELAKYIRKEFLNILEASDWMDYETKKQAIEKANSMKAYIGYPKELLNDTAVTEEYENLTIANRSYYENDMNINKWTIDDHFSYLRKPNVKGEWKTYAEAAVLNAFYHTLENSFEFPAGILQGVYFSKDRFQYLNFGGIGYIIGHEITHGFDDQGKQFDKDGNNVNWWDNTTNERYHKKAQCIIDQYSNYSVENGMKLNGVTTQGENIADNGGLKEAYRAYYSWVKDNGPEPLLPGVKYTQNQLFWISASHVWCEKVRPETLELNILSDSHSPSEFRVIGPMSNLPQFSKDFKCPPDSPMNRKDKCEVW